MHVCEVTLIISGFETGKVDDHREPLITTIGAVIARAVFNATGSIESEQATVWVS